MKNSILFMIFVFILAGCEGNVRIKIAENGSGDDDKESTDTDSGDTGNTGDSGDSGNTGDTGDTGDTGNTGNSGDSGDSGNTGDTGNSGDTGNTGNTGDTGNTGNTGDTGNTGNSGDTGNTGDTGNSGCIGNGLDEDGDGIDDNCDNCPASFNSGQKNTQNDGIGDVCEAPFNYDLLSQITVFEPFIDQQPSWSPTGGTWNYGSSEMSISTSPYGQNNYYSYQIPNGPFSVEVTFRYDEGDLGGNSYAELLFSVQQVSNDTHWYTCLFRRDNNELAIWRYAGGSSIGFVKGATATAPATDDQIHKVRVFYNGSEIRCSFMDEAGGTGEVVISGGDVQQDMSGRAGLRVYNERTVYTSFVVYQ